MPLQLLVTEVREFEAEFRLCMSAVRAAEPMEAAVDPVVLQVVAGGNHLTLDRDLVRPFELADVGWFPGTKQCLELLLGQWEDDIQDQVTATGRSPLVIGSAARGRRARVAASEHGQRSTRLLRLGEFQAVQLAAMHDRERALAVTQRLRARLPDRGQGTGEVMRPTMVRAPVATFQVLAGDVEPRVHDQCALEGIGLPERDPLPMAEQPGSQGIAFVGRVVQLGDSERQLQLVTLPSQGPAGRDRLGHQQDQRAGAGWQGRGRSESTNVPEMAQSTVRRPGGTRCSVSLTAGVRVPARNRRTMVCCRRRR